MSKIWLRSYSDTKNTLMDEPWFLCYLYDTSKTIWLGKKFVKIQNLLLDPAIVNDYINPMVSKRNFCQKNSGGIIYRNSRRVRQEFCCCLFLFKNSNELTNAKDGRDFVREDKISLLKNPKNIGKAKYIHFALQYL